MPRYPKLLLTVATVVCLAPWLNKAFDIDDPLFLWSAERILADPLDFYGGEVNWYGAPMLLSDLIKNPPLAAYYLAAVAALAGFGEVPLHLAMLIPAVATVLGCCELGARLCQRPLLTAGVLLATPAFLVSSTTVMCDVLMTALWVWSLALWLRGIDSKQHLVLATAGILMGLCALTKYFGIAVVPLALAYSIVRTRRPGAWLLWLLPPLAMCAAFEYFMHRQYNSGAFLGAASYASNSVSSGALSYGERGLIALMYGGGAVLPTLFFAPWLWSGKSLLAGLLVVALTAAALSGLGTIATGNPQDYALRNPQGIEWPTLLQCTLFLAAALSVLALVIVDVARSRDSDAVLLALWIVGTFVFTALVNWSINVRSVLPAVPAIAILIVRQLDCRGTGREPGSLRQRWVWSAVGAGLALSLALCWADARSANVNRSAADKLAQQYPARPGAPKLWFAGHWGFQYYLERAGAIPLNLQGSELHQGDVLAVPDDNPSGVAVSEDWKLLRTIEEPLVPWVTTTSLDLQTSFYSSVIGPVPYRFTRIPARKFRVFDPFAPFQTR